MQVIEVLLSRLSLVELNFDVLCRCSVAMLT